MPSNVVYALMAGRAYQSTRDRINYLPAPEGWDEPLDKRRLLSSGFEAGYFKRGNKPKQTKGVRVICESRLWGYGGTFGGKPSSCVEIK